MIQPNLRLRTWLLPALLACVPLLAACGTRDDASDGTRAQTALGGIVQRATDEARGKLATQNLSLSREIRGGESGLPKAEITPQGDLLIDGERIAIDDNQRRLLLEHRTHILAIAEAGIAIGVQGADLGISAAATALKGVLSGNTEDIERSIEAEARKIEAEAMKICDLLPALMASQQALATSLQQLAPYATMDQHDIDDCRSDVERGEGMTVEV